MVLLELVAKALLLVGLGAARELLQLLVDVLGGAEAL